MAKQIEAETLRDWLDAQQPVTVLDIRCDEDYAQWSIPGSVHLKPTRHCALDNPVCSPTRMSPSIDPS
jgi:rhodanese-related sulfurtransferase